MTLPKIFAVGQTPDRMRRLICGAIPAAAMAPPTLSFAQVKREWLAQKPIRVVVPFPPGGGVDTVARIVAQSLGTSLGQPAVVDNKPGASGALGTEIVYHEKPDGHTVEITSVDTHSIYPHVNSKVRYRAQEFTPISPLIVIGYILMASPQLPVKNLQDVFKLAKQKELSYATWGVGTTPHIGIEMIRQSASLPNMLHVAYKGAAPAVQALMAGEVDLMLVSSNIAAGYMEKLKVIGIASARRMHAFSQVPTLAEQGTPVDCDGWMGVVGPPKMSPEAADAIHHAVQRVMSDPEVQRRLRENGMEPRTGSRADFGRYLSDEYKRWGDVVRSANIVAE